MARPYIGGTSGGIKVVTSATTLTPADSGKVIILDGSGVEDQAMIVTLPPVALGLEYHFVLKAIGDETTEDVRITQASSDDDFVGHIINGAGGKDIATSSDSRIVFDQSNGSSPGDWVKIVCDGTNWYVCGTCSTAADVIFA